MGTWKKNTNRNLKNYYVLAFDPSGEFSKGKGTTGWCVMNCVNTQVEQIGTISARHYDNKYEYWDAHIQLIRKFLKQYGNNLAVSIEDYILYKQRAEAQINSNFETVRLIGILEHFCYTNAVDVHTRNAATAKTRWTNEILVHKNIVHPCLGGFICMCANDHLLATHELDAIRHAAHYTAFENLTEETLYARTRTE